jgi:hypothetical protein
MILLDTDHLSVFTDERDARHGQLNRRMEAAGEQLVTAVTLTPKQADKLGAREPVQLGGGEEVRGRAGTPGDPLRQASRRACPGGFG